MNIFIRVIAIALEVLLLAVLAYSLLGGVRLAVFNLGISKSYSRAVTMALIVVGFIVLVFFIAHLTTFYPE